MATEIINLEVKSNIKGAVTDVDALAKSVEKANYAEKELSENIQLQNEYIADQEVELARLKAIQDSIPKGGWYAGQSKLNDDIKSSSKKIKNRTNKYSKSNKGFNYCPKEKYQRSHKRYSALSNNGGFY